MNPGVDLSKNIDALKDGFVAASPQGANAWLAAVLGASRDGILIESNERIVEINDACVRLLGYSSAIELVGSPVSILSLSPQKEQLLELDRRQSNDRSPELLLAKRKDGTLIPLEVTTAAVGLTGKSHHIIILRDTTTGTNATTKTLEVAGGLSKRAAHDLNNLLAAIRCQTELVLVYETITPSVREMLQKVLTAAERASAITRQ